MTLSAPPPSSRISDVDLCIGRRIVQRRREIGITPTRLCAALGLTLEELRRCETGRTRIQIGLLHGVADALGVRLEYFFNWSPDA